jgi:predicted dehydrogenase
VASLETHWNRDSDYYAVPWRGTWAGEAGGAILGHAIHAHDLLCRYFGPVAEVQALTATRVNRIETEDCAAIWRCGFENGALATSSVTLGAARDETRLRFVFRDLTAESGTAPYAPAQDNWRFEARAPVTQAKVDADRRKPMPEVPAGFAGYLDAVADALAGRTGGRRDCWRRAAFHRTGDRDLSRGAAGGPCRCRSAGPSAVAGLGSGGRT